VEVINYSIAENEHWHYAAILAQVLWDDKRAWGNLGCQVTSPPCTILHTRLAPEDT